MWHRRRSVAPGVATATAPLSIKLPAQRQPNRQRCVMPSAFLLPCQTWLDRRFPGPKLQPPTDRVMVLPPPPRHRCRDAQPPHHVELSLDRWTKHDTKRDGTQARHGHGVHRLRPVVPQSFPRQSPRVVALSTGPPGALRIPPSFVAEPIVRALDMSLVSLSGSVKRHPGPAMTLRRQQPVHRSQWP